jgi:IS30 family transposase
LVMSKLGNHLLLTISDYCTKWVEAVALHTKCASATAGALFQIFMRLGIPRVITTDQGSEFRNELNKELASLLGIQHRLTTAYHPQRMKGVQAVEYPPLNHTTSTVSSLTAVSLAIAGSVPSSQ